MGQLKAEAVPDFADLARSWPTIPWIQIAAFRNVLPHKYRGVDIERVWAIIVRDLPAFECQLSRVVCDLGNTLNNSAG